MDNSLTIDSFGPLPVKRPASVAELCALVKETRAAKHALYPVGGRTTLDYGLPPTKPGVACDLTALAAVIDYPARDMTITVEAGITVAALQAELAKEGQWLPVDVPSPEQATLGGAVAVNASGPRRLGYGTLRDYVIGISFVTDDGVEVKAGGRVVKNVAGYDLMKLQIGALGTLGVVTQLTLKVKPKPEATTAVGFGCDDESLPAALDLLHASRTRPAAIHLSDHTISEGGTNPWWIAVIFEEKKATVEWQVSTLLTELQKAPVKDACHFGEFGFCFPLPGTEECAGRFFSGGVQAEFGFKAIVLPSRTAAFCLAAKQVEPSLTLVAAALNGVVYGHMLNTPNLERASALLNKLGVSTAEGGNLVVTRCPTEWKKSLPVFGTPPAGWELMRHVKKTLDPDNVFNPGRLFGDV